MADSANLPADQTQPRARRFWLLRLETWLVLAGLFLLFQVFPALFWGLLYIIDVRNWTWSAWVGVEIGMVVFLIALWRWQNSDVGQDSSLPRNASPERDQVNVL